MPRAGSRSSVHPQHQTFVLTMMRCLGMPRREHTRTPCGDGWSAWRVVVVWADIVVSIYSDWPFCERPWQASAERDPLTICLQAAAQIAPPRSTQQSKSRTKVCAQSIMFFRTSQPWPGLQARDMHHHQGRSFLNCSLAGRLRRRRDAYTASV